MPKPTPVAILLHENVSVALALLPEFIFRLANRLAEAPAFEVRLLAPERGFRRGALKLALCEPELPESGYLLIPPLEGLQGERLFASAELDLLRQVAVRKVVLASACLGAFLPAAAGLLDGREATTHWAWGPVAARRFPDVRWNLRAMVCDAGPVITAGGLLAVVDLCLHIVRRECGQELAAQLGRRLLADVVRPQQSLYAQALTLPPKDAGRFAALERELEGRLADPPGVPEMAAFCGMSLRSFQRHFTANYGLSPNGYLQLKRLEKARELLAGTRLGIDRVARQSGFQDPAFFRKVFARETGLSPALYRRRAAGA
jgi:transcriptional regulator GlxA family with amidase domain